jgi:predicted nucleic acid-binding protein
MEVKSKVYTNSNTKQLVLYLSKKKLKELIKRKGLPKFMKIKEENMEW